MGYDRFKKLKEKNQTEDLKSIGLSHTIFLRKNELSNIVKNYDEKLSQSTEQEIEQKLGAIDWNIKKTNPGNTIRFENDQKVENEPKFNEIDRSVKAILAFVGKPEEYYQNVDNYLNATFVSDKQILFRKAFNNCIEFKNKVDNANTLDELIDVYNENPFGFNALSELTKGIQFFKDNFRLEDPKIIDTLEKNALSFTDTSLKESILNFATDPVGAYLTVEDCQKLAPISAEDNVEAFCSQEHPEIQAFMKTSTAYTNMKDNMEIQANGVLGKRDEKGRFQGLSNEVYNIDKGFSQKETDNIDIDKMKISLNKMYDNLEKNNSFFMRWRSKSNYPDIMKEVDIARRMNNKEDMLKKLSEINKMCDNYLDYKAGDKKSKNSVLRENAIFQLNEYCKSAVEKNPITLNKNKNLNKNGITTERIQLPTELFDSEITNDKTTQHGVSFKDIQNQKNNLKHVETPNNEQVEDEMSLS